MEVTAGRTGDGRATAFVAGATGYTGRALVLELSRLGVRTVAHVRPDSPRLTEWRERFGVLGAETDATAWSGAAMRETLQRVRPDLVFALLGTTQKRARAAQKQGVDAGFEAVDYGLTMMLLRATAEAARSARFVYLSSAGTGPTAPGVYLRTRWRVEQEVRSSGPAWTIARPNFVTGPDRAEARPKERISSMLLDSALDLAAALGASSLRQRWGSLNATELARALAAYAMDPEAAGRVLTADELRARSGDA